MSLDGRLWYIKDYALRVNSRRIGVNLCCFASFCIALTPNEGMKHTHSGCCLETKGLSNLGQFLQLFCIAYWESWGTLLFCSKKICLQARQGVIQDSFILRCSVYMTVVPDSRDKLHLAVPLQNGDNRRLLTFPDPLLGDSLWLWYMSLLNAVVYCILFLWFGKHCLWVFFSNQLFNFHC